MNTDHLPEIRFATWRFAQNFGIITVITQHFIGCFGNKSAVAAAGFGVAFQRLLDHLIGVSVFGKYSNKRLRDRTDKQGMEFDMRRFFQCVGCQCGVVSKVWYMKI